jgi:predicted metal-dependent HD superfamily phosphohydrolase
MELAIWFHDAVYDTRRSDNEEESAAWSIKILRGFLDRPQIYYHREYRERFEGRARVSLELAIARLDDT